MGNLNQSFSSVANQSSSSSDTKDIEILYLDSPAQIIISDSYILPK